MLVVVGTQSPSLRILHGLLEVLNKSLEWSVRSGTMPLHETNDTTSSLSISRYVQLQHSFRSMNKLNGFSRAISSTTSSYMNIDLN